MRKVLRSLSFPTVILLAWVAASPIYGQTGREQGLETAIAAQERHTDVLMANLDVVGTAVGLNAEGEPAVIILTETRRRGFPSTLDGVPVVVRASGKIYALSHKPTHNPGGPGGGGGEDPPPDDNLVPIGVSTGHPAITAGTIGARVVDNGGNEDPADDVFYALSNNHVYAASNFRDCFPNASYDCDIGDPVIHPGTFDGGSTPDDDIGTLDAYVRIDFAGGNNVVDAAIASVDPLVVGNSTPSYGYGTPKSTIIQQPSVNMKVKKHGRTTGLTKGNVYAINATVDVNYGVGVARFVNQIIIQPGSFSAGGDSGSLVVADAKGKNKADNNKPVALLFAGNMFFTIANPIDAVLTRFGVAIDGN